VPKQILGQPTASKAIQPTAPLASKQQQQQPDPAPAIRSRIQALESELEQSRRKANEMGNLLENTRTHYAQLESRYNQARDVVKKVVQERFV
jgi:hypothetical protein